MDKEIVKILLVEDDISNAEILQEMLLSLDYFTSEVDFAKCLSDAVDLLQSKNFDVILLDLELPDSKGENTILSVQEESTAPIIVITSLEEELAYNYLSRYKIANYLIKGKFSSSLLGWIIFHSIENKITGATLKDPEEKFRVIFENSAIAITVADDKERIVSWNRFTEQLLGMDRDDLYMKPVSSLYSEEEWKRIRSLDIRKDGLRQNMEAVMIRKDGSSLDVEISITVLKDSNNAITGSIGVIKDVSERKKLERKLNEKARKSDIIFQLMQNLTPDLEPMEMLGLIIEAAGAIVKADTSSIILLDEHQKELKKVAAAKSTDERAGNEYVLQPLLDENTSITGWVIENKKPIMLFGKTTDNKRFKNIKCREDIKCSINVPIMYKDSVKGTINLNITTSDIIFEAEDLDAAIALASHTAIALENSGLYKSMKDLYISELKNSNDELQKMNIELSETRNQLVQTGKMAAIGQLASGVAHEINNPLSGVLGNIQIIKMELKSGGKLDDLDELLTVIEESARRCKSITQQLLDFSRAKKDVFEAFDIHKSLNSTVMLVGYGLKNSGIEIIKKFSDDVPTALGNQNEIQQIFLNMISNAKWAIEQKGEEGGSLTIATRKIDEKFIEASFTDTGIGMSDESAQRIFEAFYTTKEVGEGTGLGLSICYEIMQRHNGDLTVESQEGVGTTFRIKIPLAGKASATSPWSPAKADDKNLDEKRHHQG